MNKSVYIGFGIGFIIGVIVVALAFIDLSLQQTHLPPQSQDQSIIFAALIFLILTVFFGTFIGLWLAQNKYAKWILKGAGIFLVVSVLASYFNFLFYALPFALLFILLPFMIAILIYFRSEEDFTSQKSRVLIALVILVVGAIILSMYHGMGDLIGLPIKMLRQIILILSL